PTRVDTDGHYVLINTAVGRIKHRNIKKNPQVALAITEQGNPYKLVMIKGRVIEEVTGHVAEDHIDKMAKKYTGAEKYQNRRPGEKRVLLKIEPNDVSRMRYMGVGRLANSHASTIHETGPVAEKRVRIR